MDKPPAFPNLARTVSQRVSASYKASGLSLNGLATASGIARTTLRRKLDGHAEFTASELLILQRVLPGRFIDWVQDLIKEDVA